MAELALASAMFPPYFLDWHWLFGLCWKLVGKWSAITSFISWKREVINQLEAALEIIRGIQNIKNSHAGCVLTIGNFDGLHLGHQALLNWLKQKSKELGLPSLAIIFEPQPNEFFNKEVLSPRLMRFREKVHAFSKFGIDRILCLRFDQKMARMTAELFVRTILIEKLSAKYVLVGDDFHFGYKRLGNYKLLTQLAEKYHFKAECLETFKVAGERVSSTRIRKLLGEGQLELAAILLGHPYSMCGKVIHGDKRGRLLGIPTANIGLQRKVIPLRGVFAVEMLGVDSSPLPGVANIGTRPTVKGQAKTLLEVHLLDFDREIYGHQVEVVFLKKFRDEQKFADFETLKKQILQDIEDARSFHGITISKNI